MNKRVFLGTTNKYKLYIWVALYKDDFFHRDRKSKMAGTIVLKFKQRNPWENNWKFLLRNYINRLSWFSGARSITEKEEKLVGLESG